MKYLKRCVIPLLVLLMICSFFSGCGSKGNESNTYVGTWTLASYKYKDKYYTTEEMTKQMGSQFCDIYGKITIKLSNKGTLKMGTSGNIDNGSYEISDESLLIYNDSGELEYTVPIVNNRLEVEIPDSSIILVFEKS